MKFTLGERVLLKGSDEIIDDQLYTILQIIPGEYKGLTYYVLDGYIVVNETNLIKPNWFI